MNPEKVLKLSEEELSYMISFIIPKNEVYKILSTITTMNEPLVLCFDGLFGVIVLGLDKELFLDSGVLYNTTPLSYHYIHNNKMSLETYLPGSKEYDNYINYITIIIKSLYNNSNDDNFKNIVNKISIINRSILYINFDFGKKGDNVVISSYLYDSDKYLNKAKEDIYEH